jgi:hypothetical protein
VLANYFNVRLRAQWRRRAFWLSRTLVSKFANAGIRKFIAAGCAAGASVCSLSEKLLRVAILRALLLR